ncbi:hypothetical protein COL940_006478 [Colletotrichum noveboracense]|nr:hypothetical protein COL940_006478 [Colletotrichum noveboracense]KAJ0286936.1 hypothetical protein CBS470a_005626 [Colletotrichum nupharicola]
MATPLTGTLFVAKIVDSLEAAQYLTNTVVTSDAFSMAKHDCIFAHVNTTVVSLCNGSQRNRIINRDEARRGIDQLIKDCGLNGGFTGIHVVNNLTFAAYGVGGLSLSPPPGSNPPDVPGSRKRSLGRSLARRDCAWAYDGVPHLTIVPESNCQAFCELRRTGFLGHEERAPGEGGNQMLPGEAKELGGGFETSISNGFSIGVEGIFKEVIGAGVSYESDDPDCVGDLENVANVCSLVPKLNPDGEPEVFWAVRYEYEDGTPLPFDQQHFSYKTPCVSDDPDGDGEKECYNHIPALMLAPNYKKLEEAIGATNA